MTSPSPAHLRRSPSQQRSRDRVERILDAAAAIVDEEAWTPSRSSTSPNGPPSPRHAVPVLRPQGRHRLRPGRTVRAAIRRGPRGLLGGLDPTAGWHELLDLLLDTYTAYYRSEPALQECRSGRGSIPEFIAPTATGTRFCAPSRRCDGRQRRRSHGRVVDDDLRLLGRRARHSLETAFRSDPDGDPAIIEQTKIMAARYLAGVRAGRTAATLTMSINRRIRCTATADDRQVVDRAQPRLSRRSGLELDAAGSPWADTAVRHAGSLPSFSRAAAYTSPAVARRDGAALWDPPIAGQHTRPRTAGRAESVARVGSDRWRALRLIRSRGGSPP